MELNFEFNWCEYLTPCPNGQDCMVGEYECQCQCKHFVSSKIIEDLQNENGVKNMKRYFEVGKGKLICNFNKKNT